MRVAAAVVPAAMMAKLQTLRARRFAKLGLGQGLRLVGGEQELLHLVALALRNADRGAVGPRGRAVTDEHGIQLLQVIEGMDVMDDTSLRSTGPRNTTSSKRNGESVGSSNP